MSMLPNGRKRPRAGTHTECFGIDLRMGQPSAPKKTRTAAGCGSQNTVGRKKKNSTAKTGDLKTVIDAEKQRILSNIAREEIVLRKKYDELRHLLETLDSRDILASRKHKCLVDQIAAVKETLDKSHSDDLLAQFTVRCADYIAVYEEQRSKPVTNARSKQTISKEAANRLSRLGCIAVKESATTNTPRLVNDVILVALVEDFQAACRGEPHLGPLECVKNAHLINHRANQTPSATPGNDASDICTKCRVPVIFCTSTSTLVCPTCGRSESYIDTASIGSSYAKENDNTSPYKRINHLNDNLMCFQAKEPKLVPQNVIEAVMLRFALVDNITAKDMHLITDTKIRHTLKPLGFRRYYDNIPQIKERITGQKPPQMTPAQEDRVRHRFLAAQAPFERHCPPNRKNFLSYPYTIYKICEIEGWVIFMPCFRLPKGKDKRRAADHVWAKVCQDLDGKDPTMPWPYIDTPPPPPSVR